MHYTNVKSKSHHHHHRQPASRLLKFMLTGEKNKLPKFSFSLYLLLLNENETIFSLFYYYDIIIIIKSKDREILISLYTLT